MKTVFDKATRDELISRINALNELLSEIKRIKNRQNALSFNSVYGFYSYQNLTKNIKAILNASLERYLK